MYSMDVLCVKSKVVHFNTTVCLQFLHLLNDLHFYAFPAVVLVKIRRLMKMKY